MNLGDRLHLGGKEELQGGVEVGLQQANNSEHMDLAIALLILKHNVDLAEQSIVGESLH